MGIYYHIANYEKRQIIDLSDVASIKWDAYSSWSLQGAILNTFLGFNWPRLDIDLGGWVGCWAHDKIVIEADNKDHESGLWQEMDAGMVFLADLWGHRKLPAWLDYTGLSTWDSQGDEYELRQWMEENMSWWRSMIPGEGVQG